MLLQYETLWTTLTRLGNHKGLFHSGLGKLTDRNRAGGDKNGRCGRRWGYWGPVASLATPAGSSRQRYTMPTSCDAMAINAIDMIQLPLRSIIRTYVARH
jgi:hypothetical protein